MSLALGIHLVRGGVVTSEQFVDALEEQVRSRPQLGQLALAEGMLGMSELFEVLSVQTFEEKAFGEIAVERGFLTKSQLATLLMKQQGLEVSVCETLIELGAITQADLTRHQAEWMHTNRCRESISVARRPHDEAMSA